ncbi:hypothetical protein WJX74_006420 [Apatococcus lobatus]|uniref:Hexosyltransferase n=1 Tax=Apatococcus lobatus TaxID=904363 RepID=A0AAW1QJE0_9CHLO
MGWCARWGVRQAGLWAVSLILLLRSGECVENLRALRAKHAQVLTSARPVCTVPENERQTVRAFMGAMAVASPDPTGKFSGRRQDMRDTWFPSTKAGLDDFQKRTGIVLRMVMGSKGLLDDERVAMQQEADKHGPFLWLPIKEQYKELYAKTQSFLSIVTCHYDAQWIVKVDDDIYISLEKVPALLEQWERKGVGYAGCFEHKWGYADSPHHASYYKGDGTKFAVGPFYAIDGKLATAVQRANLPLRFFTNEDVGTSNMMKVLDVEWTHDGRVCAAGCHANAVGIVVHSTNPAYRGACTASELKDDSTHRMSTCFNRLHQECSAIQDWQPGFEAAYEDLKPWTDWAEEEQIELDAQDAAREAAAKAAGRRQMLAA